MGLIDLFPGLEFIEDKLQGNEETVTQEAMLTPEQKEAMGILLNYGKTGRTPTGFQAGEAADLSGFNFDLSGTEGTALNRLNSLISQGSPAGLDTARNTLTSLSDVTFDPSDPKNGFGAFKRLLAREIGDANDVINRESAITGSRYGSRILGQKRDLAAQQSDIIASRLADLYNTSANRALQASTGLADVERLGQGLEQDRINQAISFGGLPRDIQNAKAQLEYDERQRQRSEQLNALTGVESVFNRNVPFGIKSQTVTTPSPFSQLLNTGLQVGGAIIGGSIGGPAGAAAGGQAGSSFGSLFTKSRTQPKSLIAQDYTPIGGL